MADVLRDLPAAHDLPAHDLDGAHDLAAVHDFGPAGDVDLLTAGDLIAAVDAIKRFVKSLEPRLYSGEDAKRLAQVFSEGKHACASGVMLAARRVEETHLHEREGHRRPQTFLASITGESVGSAASMLETAKSLEAHPAISEAFRSGSISEAKAKEIASAADARPDQANNLLEAASSMELGGLRRHCADVRHSALSGSDSVERYEQMRAKRFCRMWTDSENFGRLEARLTPDALAVLKSCLDPFEHQAFKKAREEGRLESHQVYAADALVAMAKASREGTRTSKGSDTLVRIRVDLGALRRGHPIPGETCQIPGIAPVPVALARQVLGDSLLELVVTEGQDVRAVCTNSRHITRALRIALEERDQTCCVRGCDRSDPLEIDHRTDYAKGGETKLENLARLCAYHHDQKTYRGWRLEGGPGNWRFVRPDPPPESDHPEHLDHRDQPDRRNHRDQRDDRNDSDDPIAPRKRGARSKRATGPPGQDTLL